MYLTAQQYVGNWKHSDKSEANAYSAVAKAVGLDHFVCEGSPHLYVEVCVAYWRKANQIHHWFVKNVQDGEDECREHYVERAQLQTLLDLCKQVLETKDATPLPPQKGFFFGSTEIDEWYWEDLKNTVAQLTPLLTEKRWECWEFHYRSSW